MAVRTMTPAKVSGERFTMTTARNPVRFSQELGALGLFQLDAKGGGKPQAANSEAVVGQVQSHRASSHRPFLFGMIAVRTLADHSAQASFAPGVPKEVTTGPTGPFFQRGFPALSMTRTPGAFSYLPMNVSQ